MNTLAGFIVFFRGYIYEFTPQLINWMFLLENVHVVVDQPLIQAQKYMDEAVILASGGKVTHMEDLVSKNLMQTMVVLHKMCCHNWMPTTNQTTLKHDRIHMMYMVENLKPFNFGKLVVDEIF